MTLSFDAVARFKAKGGRRHVRCRDFRQTRLSRTLLGTASWERGRLARKWDGEAAADQCGRDARVPRTPCPRKRLRGVKSAEMPLEPTPNRGRTPSPRGKKYLAYRPPPSISIAYEQRPGLRQAAGMLGCVSHVQVKPGTGKRERRGAPPGRTVRSIRAGRAGAESGTRCGPRKPEPRSAPRPARRRLAALASDRERRHRPRFRRRPGQDAIRPRRRPPFRESGAPRGRRSGRGSRRARRGG